jgi:hypothetical protein
MRFDPFEMVAGLRRPGALWLAVVLAAVQLIGLSVLLLRPPPADEAPQVSTEPARTSDEVVPSDEIGSYPPVYPG